MRLEAGQWLLVEGAAGHVGTKLVQAAKAMGRLLPRHLILETLTC
ncbi:hypothetical protein SAG0136_03240 [Streptococcus agalactiae LMG 14747]|uniref:Uncharacterized protein n=1 Tax=Streptococcus agalactiae LMG 14747 TaxID=1154860 RepID=V6Z0A3_STRAG|nr:hypothetical protein SAG0136_03240 [Streptococcus agalactiae LMG 14747]